MFETIKRLMSKWEAILFPEQKIYQQRFSSWKLFLLFIVLTVVFTIIGSMIPVGGMIGFDWSHFYGIGRVPPFYPPWTIYIVKLLTWPLLIGLTIASFAIASIKRSVHLISLIVSFFCLPLMWTLFLGQLEGITLFGLLWMPWLVPMALIKPQLAFFAFGAKKQYLIVAVIFLVLSLIIFGLWPIKTLSVESFYGEGRYQQNIGIGLWGLPLALIAFWVSRGDLDMLMLSGCLMLPHLIPYNLLPASPAIARLKPVPAILATLFSWLPLISNKIGPIGWWFGWIFILWLWGNLAIHRYPKSKLALFLQSIPFRFVKKAIKDAR